MGCRLVATKQAVLGLARVVAVLCVPDASSRFSTCLLDDRARHGATVAVLLSGAGCHEGRPCADVCATDPARRFCVHRSRPICSVTDAASDHPPATGGRRDSRGAGWRPARPTPMIAPSHTSSAPESQHRDKVRPECACASVAISSVSNATPRTTLSRVMKSLSAASSRKTSPGRSGHPPNAGWQARGTVRRGLRERRRPARRDRP